VTYPTPVVWRPAGWRKSQDKDRGDESCTDRLEECKLGRVIWAGYSKNRTRFNAAARRDLGDEEQAAGLEFRCAACEECAPVRFRTFLSNSPFGAVRRQIDAGAVILELTPDAGCPVYGKGRVRHVEQLAFGSSRQWLIKRLRYLTVLKRLQIRRVQDSQKLFPHFRILL
jgi:hypothetical protein